MRKFLFSLAAFFAVIPSFATKTNIPIVIYGKTRTENCGVDRSLKEVPIDVFFDDESRTIDVMCGEGVEGDVYVCDKNGSVVASAKLSDMPLTITSSYHGVCYLLVDIPEWYATASIVI